LNCLREKLDTMHVLIVMIISNQSGNISEFTQMIV
jgi:hypothetical protein